MSLEMPRIMIGIAGPSCSGKSTLTDNLESRLGDEIAVFPFDDLFVGLDALGSSPSDGWEDPGQYRWNDYRGHMRALQSGEEVELEAKSPASEAVGIESRLIKPRPVIVAAGFLALRDETVNGLFDTTLFIDLPDDEMIKRRRQRANPDNPWDSEEYIEKGLVPGTEKYVLPQRDAAGHILNGLLPPDELAEETLQIIRETQAI